MFAIINIQLVANFRWKKRIFCRYILRYLSQKRLALKFECVINADENFNLISTQTVKRLNSNNMWILKNTLSLI